jgi:uncharacterized membrane protein (UPF0127 family)
MAKLLTVLNETRGVILGDRVQEAASFWTRAKGLLGRSGLKEGEGLLLYPCWAIHSYGMKFEFDALYLDRQYRVVHIIDSMPPNRRGPSMRKKVFAVLELPAGTAAAAATAIGDQLVVRQGTNPYASE